jgi:acetyl-CoA carboxylase, biotin carboxylase subunit
MPGINKILIANRGEIALRIIRTCKDMGIQTVAVFSEADRAAPHILHADESVFIGQASSSGSYLAIHEIIEAAKDTGADAIHPGYGFLSENAGFAAACEEAEVLFIGPKPESIRLMGDKTKAREIIDGAGVPYPPGTQNALKNIKEAEQVAWEIGFPVLIKAAAGGGGKGMRIIEASEEFTTGIKAAKSEARSAFGDDRVYIEKYINSPRHVEFQILADTHGNVVHLFDRECSIQRRHQKVIEEAPCSVLLPELRDKMSAAAISAAKACNYIGAGTVEFLVDKQFNYYFLEMNTRLQVEHPVTELITGIDLVEMQIRVAMGEKLPFVQKDIEMNGHAIECRIYAEDPENNFLPSTGTLTRHRPANGPGVRVDAGVEEGQKISIHYDPMISKLCTYASTRSNAISRMSRALDEYEIAGCRTTIPFCQFVMNHSDFCNGNYDTHFIQKNFSPDKLNDTPKDISDVLSISSSMLLNSFKNDLSLKKAEIGKKGIQNHSNWWDKRR